MGKGMTRNPYAIPRHLTHGKTHTKLYGVRTAMIQRCYNPNNQSYPNYGARGISVCDEWREDFQSFYYWAMSSGYAEGMSIDRIDNNGNYCPENCRWATATEQGNNKRNNVFIECNGERHSMKEWSEITGLSVKKIDSRRRAGWDAERILYEPTHSSKIRKRKSKKGQ